MRHSSWSLLWCCFSLWKKGKSQNWRTSAPFQKLTVVDFRTVKLSNCFFSMVGNSLWSAKDRIRSCWFEMVYFFVILCHELIEKRIEKVGLFCQRKLTPRWSNHINFYIFVLIYSFLYLFSQSFSSIFIYLNFDFRFACILWGFVVCLVTSRTVSLIVLYFSLKIHS